MNPQTIARLNENVPEFKELRAFLTSEYRRLDSLDGLETLPFKERAYEVSARLQAKAILGSILGSLVGQVVHSGTDPKEYMVD